VFLDLHVSTIHRQEDQTWCSNFVLQHQWGSRLVDCLWWGETDVLELRPVRAYRSSPDDLRWGMIILTEASSQLVYQSQQYCPAVLPSETSLERVGEGNENLVYPSPWDFKRSFTCRKILRHATSSFTSRQKEGVLRIFIAFAGLEPAIFGSSGSTVTNIPPRWPREVVSQSTDKSETAWCWAFLALAAFKVSIWSPGFLTITTKLIQIL
jgi:hypothetical protein